MFFYLPFECMSLFNRSVKKENLISVAEFRRLLFDIAEKRPGVCLRYRLLGELWARDFLSIAGITENGIVLKDDSGTRLTVVTNLSDIIQFEIDEPFQGFRPYNHYEVRPTVEG